MRYDRELRHATSVGFLEIFRSIFVLTLPLVSSNSWDAQHAVPNDPRYALLETNLGIGQAKEGRVITVRRQSCDTLAEGGRALSC
ncbi:hypothetical protein TNCV_1342691 [Trichonephila clavipes]|nr:hypothetical protein TNCV_1342691 [Trichonephila clavipes]